MNFQPPSLKECLECNGVATPAQADDEAEVSKRLQNRSILHEWRGESVVTVSGWCLLARLQENAFDALCTTSFGICDADGSGSIDLYELNVYGVAPHRLFFACLHKKMKMEFTRFVRPFVVRAPNCRYFKTFAVERVTGAMFQPLVKFYFDG